MSRNGVSARMRVRPSGLAAFFAALLVVFAAAIVPARAEVELGKRLALVIGNSQYQTLESLRNAASDAQLVARTLTDLGFTVTLLTNATHGQMTEAIAKIKEDGKDAEAVLFYYSGHGFQHSGSNFIVPVAATLRDRAAITSETIELNTLINQLGNPERPTIILIDACRNNPLAADLREQDGLAQVSASINNTYVLFATQPGNVSHDGRENNGPFALALEANLTLPDEDFVAVMKKVRADVNRRTAGLQTPWEQSSMLVDFEFNVGLQSGVLLADMPPPPAIDFGDTPPAGTSEDVASLEPGGLVIEDMPEDLVRGTQVESGPALVPVEPTITPAIAEPEPIVPDIAPEPTTTVASVDPKQVLAPLGEDTAPDGDTVATTPTPAITPEPEPEIEPQKLAELVQGELKRIGCYTSTVDGDWGKGSRNALARYFEAKKVASIGTEPTMEIKAMLQAEPPEVCKAEPVVTTPKAPKKTPVVADNDAPAAPKKQTVTPKAAEPAAPKKGLTLKGGGIGSFR